MLVLSLMLSLTKQPGCLLKDIRAVNLYKYTKNWGDYLN
ncbi:hypothetical protein FHW89_005733 [Mucilaginibacter sp. SG564]|nr:hypothetical protein [Mucilaginibacter sp. SG564]